MAGAIYLKGPMQETAVAKVLAMAEVQCEPIETIFYDSDWTSDAAFKTMLDAIKRREITMVFLHSVECFTSLDDFRVFLAVLQTSWCDIAILKQDVNSRRPFGRTLFNLAREVHEHG